MISSSIKKILANITFKILRKDLRKLANSYFYESRLPSPQNAIDIFAGMWSSKFPNNSIVESKAVAKGSRAWEISFLGLCGQQPPCIHQWEGCV